MDGAWMGSGLFWRHSIVRQWQGRAGQSSLSGVSRRVYATSASGDFAMTICGGSMGARRDGRAGGCW